MPCLNNRGRFKPFPRGLASLLRLSLLVTLSTIPIQAPGANSAPTADSAPVVAAAMIGPLLSRDIATTLAQGGLGPPASAGVVIGVARDGLTRVFAFGAAKPDSIFEIGSGLTGGFTTYAFFNRSGGYAAIVLTNAGSDPFANLLGTRISQLFSGRSADSLSK